MQTSRSSTMALKQWLEAAEIRRTPSYAIYQIEARDRVITTCESGKLVFQGGGAEECTALVAPSTIQKTQNGAVAKKTQGQPEAIYPQAGSDKVGTGDYFGPVAVCVTCVHHENVEFLRSLGIQDSKTTDDIAIRRMTPRLTERLPHSLLILDNATYNRVHGENNMVVIGSRMHNQAYVHLHKEMGSLPQFCTIDQFVQKTSYYHCLKYEREVVYDTHFETKAKNKYLSVAAGSIIAQYAFLKIFGTMYEQYDLTFLKGTGGKVNQGIRRFVAIHGKEALLQVAKLHFASTERTLD